MKAKLGFIAAIAIAMVSCAPREYVILYENDVHCNTQGYARFAYLADSLQANAVVSAGDFLMGGPKGSASKGAWIVPIVNSVGYDALALGNHELDKTPAHLKVLASELNAPIVCCNFDALDTLGNHSRVFAPYIIKKFGCRKVAFVGVLTPNAFASCSPRNFMDSLDRPTYSVNADRFIPVVQESIDAARRQGAKTVILLSHVGVDESDGAMTSRKMISCLKNVDAVIDGHSHTLIPFEKVKDAENQEVVLTQTGCYFNNFGVMRLSRRGAITTEMIPFASVHGERESVKAVVDSIDAIYNVFSSRVVGKSNVEMLAQEGNQWLTRNAEMPIGDFMADAIKYVSGAECAIMNGGGIRNNIRKGTLTFGDIYAAFSFDNELCVATISGQKLHEAVEYSFYAYPEKMGGFLQVSGLRFKVDSSVPSPVVNDAQLNFVEFREGAQWRTSQLEILGKDGKWRAVTPDGQYRVAALTFLLVDGGSGYRMLRNSADDIISMPGYDVATKYIEEGLGGVIPASYCKSKGLIRID